MRLVDEDRDWDREAVRLASLVRVNFAHMQRGVLLLPEQVGVAALFGNTLYAESSLARTEVTRLREVLSGHPSWTFTE